MSKKLALFTSESVTMGHPDKVADSISDAILDSLIKPDPHVRAAIETLVTTDTVVVSGEITVHNEAAKQALKNIEQTIRRTIQQIGYTRPGSGFDYKTCKIDSKIHPQSEDISRGITRDEKPDTEQGAGDQGMMFGYACNETKSLMPLPIQLAHRLVKQLALVRELDICPWVLPDGKSQVTIEYEDGKPVGIHNIVISTQHTEDVISSSTDEISDIAKEEILENVIKPAIQHECPQFSKDNFSIHINPTGRFVIGGPHGDTGLTGRKIIVDTYGSMGRHGGGAFSGKDPTKVDRSAAYMARYIAKNIVSNKLADRCEVQLAYAIGVAEPVSVLIDTFGTGSIEEDKLERIVRNIFPLTPAGIIKELDLRRPIYYETSHHGHFGGTNSDFTWEKLWDYTILLNRIL